MGVLVLAWGNSFGDLVADTTMSRGGHLNMAIFGVFAAHIQNVLFTLGTAFLITTLESSSKSVTINKIDTKVFFGITIVATVLLGSFTLVPTLGKFTLPRWSGFVLLSFYIIFALVALLLELQIFGKSLAL
jgi:Ca2+/Na+ antiporter